MTNIAYIDKIRKQNGYLSISETIALSDKGNIVYDPFSTLISKAVNIGRHNIFYPNIVIEAKNSSGIIINNKNILHNNTKIFASHGNITIGNENIIGEGNILIKANAQDSEIMISDQTRFVGNISIFGKTDIGNGCQVFDNITLVSCVLEGGMDFTFNDPNMRGAVVKGYGSVKGMSIKKGYSLIQEHNGDKNIISQSKIHTKTES